MVRLSVSRPKNLQVKVVNDSIGPLANLATPFLHFGTVVDRRDKARNGIDLIQRFFLQENVELLTKQDFVRHRGDRCIFVVGGFWHHYYSVANPTTKVCQRIMCNDVSMNLALSSVIFYVKCQVASGYTVDSIRLESPDDDPGPNKWNVWRITHKIEHIYN